MNNTILSLVIFTLFLSCTSETGENHVNIHENKIDNPKNEINYEDELSDFFEKEYKTKKHSFYPEELYIAFNSDRELRNLWLKYNSEAGMDNFYAEFSKFLRNKIGIDNYHEERNRLIKLFRLTNEYFKIIKSGGTFFGHQHKRIPGFVESEIHQLFINNYDIEKRAMEYLNKKSNYLNRYKLEMNKIPNTEIENKKERLTEILQEIDGLITNYFYLKKLADFDRYYI